MHGPAGPDSRPTLWAFAPGPADLWRLIAAAAGHGGASWREFIVKVNWFSPHPANYTGPAALDQLLASLPGPATVIESHSSGRTDGSRWLGPGQVVGEARDWLRRQERQFLRETGLQAIIDRHAAAYLNVTEEVWAGRTVDPEVVRRAVAERGPGGSSEPIVHPELLGFVPSALYDRRGAALLIDFARLKLSAPGEDTAFSLGLKNMFGVIPEPARTDYHDNLPASVLDVNRIYHALFDVVTICEGLENVILYRPGGEHATPWGDYDILTGPKALAVAGRNPLEVDAAAAALFGIDLSARTLFREAARFFPACSHETLARARAFGREHRLGVA